MVQKYKISICHKNNPLANCAIRKNNYLKPLQKTRLQCLVFSKKSRIFAKKSLNSCPHIMLKKIPFVLFLVLFIFVCQSCNRETDAHTATDGSNCTEFSTVEQLFEAGWHHHQVSKNIDSALIYYDKVINSGPICDFNEHYERIFRRTYRWLAQIYFNMGNYRAAHEMLLQALRLNESSDDIYTSQIYMSLGNIYMRLNEFDLAKSYYSEALRAHATVFQTLSTLAHLAYLEIKMGNLDSALKTLNQSLQIAQQHNEPVLPRILYSFAEYYRAKNCYDSAYLYYKLTFDAIEQSEATPATIALTARALSSFGEFFFEHNKLDSAIYYIGLSNTIATEHYFLRTLSANYLTLSKIARARNQNLIASEYFRQHSNINDSIFNLRAIADINQMRRSRTDQQIERLVFRQRIKEEQIRYQAILLYIILGVLGLVGAGLLFFFFQNKKLNFANRVLVDKNLEIIELQKYPSETASKKRQKSALSDELQEELLERIYSVMEDVSVVCDPELTVEKLADLVQSNRAYVSHVINDASKKNFRAFLNEYRIREAQRLISEVDFSKYTLEAIVHKTGFKSRSTFNSVFKEITGVNPKFYLESVQKR